MKYTCSDLVLDLLENYGIKDIFGYPGGAIIPFYDKLKNHKNIKHYLFRNEQGAGFAASGYARSTGKIGICATTSGPGAANIITSINDCFMDSIPTLFITGQVPSSTIGKDMFQESDIVGITMNITKHNFLIDNPNDVLRVFSDAIEIATSGRPGPVLIDFPKDIQQSFCEKTKTFPKIKKQNHIELKTNYKKDFFDLLNSAKKPILLIGHGIVLSNGKKEINKFIEKTEIPTVSTLLAKGLISKKNKNYLGFLGMHGFYHSNLAVANADLIINIGSRFDDRIVGNYNDFGKNAKIIHIDIDKSELNKVVKTDLAINSDAKDFLKNILEDKNLKNLEIGNWKDEIEKYKNIGNYQKTTSYFSMKNVIYKVQKQIEKNLDDYIIVTDVGQHQMWSSLNLNLENPYNWLTSGGAGTMGFGLPNAIGAAIANPKKKIIMICGDGSFQMNIQELATIKDYNLDIKIFILNNSFLGMVRQWQDLFYDKNYSQVAISSPNFKKLAESYGIDGVNIKNEKELDKNLEKILDFKGAFLTNIFVEKEDNVFPMVPAGENLSNTLLN